MEFEEISDMAITAIRRKGMGKLGENSMKLIRLIKLGNVKEEITNSIILLMFLAEQNKINLEDAILNKIEDMNKR